VNESLRKIPVAQLSLGMHLKAFCGSWLDHPFWRTGFVLTDPKDLEAVRVSRIQEVWIDCARGLAPPEAEAEPQVASTTEAPPEPEPEVTAPAPLTAARAAHTTTLDAEIEHARRICHDSHDAVVTMFQEARLGRALNAKAAQNVVEDIAGSVIRNPNAIVSLARLKKADDYSFMHSVAVCALMVSLARQLSLDDALVRSAGMAGLLHDIGKAMMPPEVLGKPGRLTEAEFNIIKGHPKAGHDLLLTGTDVDPHALEVCLHHHEKMDGSGYPDGLKGDEITLLSKMGAICDVYDAITSNRPYKSGWDPAESLKKMAEWSAGHFDPVVFKAFVKSLGIYPIGSLVRLSSGRLAVVVDQTPKSPTQPIVKAFYSTRSNLRIRPELIDLAKSAARERIVDFEDPAVWKFHDLDQLWLGPALS
jgi:putative nucleotidyltransferase with HDIG domain